MNANARITQPISPRLFDTRESAHARVQPTTLQTRARIMDFAEQRGARGFCVDELVEAWACTANHVAPRCTELVKSRQLVVIDRTRLTSSGSSARVLIAAKFAEKRPTDPAAPAEDYRLFPDDVAPRHLDLG